MVLVWLILNGAIDQTYNKMRPRRNPVSVLQDNRKTVKILSQNLAPRFSELLQMKQLPIDLACIETIPEDSALVETCHWPVHVFWRLGEQGVYSAIEEHSIAHPTVTSL